MVQAEFEQSLVPDHIASKVRVVPDFLKDDLVVRHLIDEKKYVYVGDPNHPVTVRTLSYYGKQGEEVPAVICFPDYEMIATENPMDTHRMAQYLLKLREGLVSPRDALSSGFSAIEYHKAASVVTGSPDHTVLRVIAHPFVQNLNVYSTHDLVYLPDFGTTLDLYTGAPRRGIKEIQQMQTYSLPRLLESELMHNNNLVA